MDYNQITSFLDKFKKVFFEKEEIIRIIIEVINKKTSINIEKSSLQIKNTTIYIKGSPLLRGEVLMKKEVILSELAEALPDRHFYDIC